MRDLVSDGTTGTLRAMLLLLVVLGIVGTAVALAYERHWDGVWQLVLWATLLVISIAVAALLIRTTQVTLLFVRIVAVLTVVSAILGLWQHFDENYKTAPLDSRYTDRWGTMSTGGRLWVVASGSVGHVPITAAGAMVPIGLAMAMVTVGLEGPPQVSTQEGRRKY